mgnify:CR=1 FL=1
MNYPLASRRIWAAKSRKEKPTVDHAASLFDPSVVERLSAEDIKPRYNPGPLKVFRPILVPPPVKVKKAKAKAKVKAKARPAAKKAAKKKVIKVKAKTKVKAKPAAKKRAVKKAGKKPSKKVVKKGKRK